MEDWTNGPHKLQCHVILENASSSFVFNKTPGLALLSMLCDNHVPGVLAQVTRPLARGQQGEECHHRRWEQGHAYQLCSWSRQALGGPPMQALCCLRFHSTSSLLIRAFCVSSVAFSTSIILCTTSYRERTKQSQINLPLTAEF